MVEASLSSEDQKQMLKQGLSVYRRFYFGKSPEQRSHASYEIDKMLRREKSKDASLGIEVKRKSRQAGIANLSYKEISKIFAYLDADTILTIHTSAKDVISFKKNPSDAVVRLIKFRGTL